MVSKIFRLQKNDESGHVSISSTFYARVVHAKVLCTAFLYVATFWLLRKYKSTFVQKQMCLWNWLHVTHSNLFRIIVMVRNELVVMLPPSEDIRPVRQVVRDDWKTISPSLYDRFHVVERILIIQQNVMSKIRKNIVQK